MKDGTDPMCRTGNRYDETIDHSVSGCPELVTARKILNISLGYANKHS